MSANYAFPFVPSAGGIFVRSEDVRMWFANNMILAFRTEFGFIHLLKNRSDTVVFWYLFKKFHRAESNWFIQIFFRIFALGNNSLWDCIQEIVFWGYGLCLCLSLLFGGEADGLLLSPNHFPTLTMLDNQFSVARIFIALRLIP